jgi:hypothetical protein
MKGAPPRATVALLCRYESSYALIIRNTSGFGTNTRL